MKLKSLIALTLCAAPFVSMAHNLSVGSSLPDITVEKHGEITLKGEEVSYSEWNNQKMLGKVRIIQAIAGRKSSKKMNAPLMTAIGEAKFPEDSYQTTSIINQDDAMWGTGSFVKSSAQDSKKEFPWSSIVLDKDGSVANAWELQEESSAIIVLDKQGQILFVKEGALNEAEIQDVLNLVKSNL
ncbi:YtfJ family protein [Vibrio hannami]|uniref:YtfJ family protein n=1 Tax=Vibrio hannami TaxID=2717094 RepID=UPI002410B431|nr:YtfJ family protein [Vibrio hannami]MDG3087024.1 YtfJ family protein [Vibrio hannami]